MKYRLIASDIDGTLTEVRDEVTPRTRQMLRKLVGQGVAFMVATGRGYRSAEKVLKALDIPCYACLNNGAVLLSYPDRKLLHTNYLSVEEKNLIVEKGIEVGVNILIYNGFEGGDKFYYSDGYFNQVITKMLNTPDQRICVTDLVKDIDHPIPVVSCVDLEEDIDRVVELLQPYREQFNILKLKEHNIPGYFWLMVTRKDVDKVHGIKSIASLLGIEQKEIIAIGDDMNDLEMIKYAGLGIAMENGVEPLKVVANKIAPPCGEDGLAQILEEVFGG